MRTRVAVLAALAFLGCGETPQECLEDCRKECIDSGHGEETCDACIDQHVDCPTGTTECTSQCVE